MSSSVTAELGTKENPHPDGFIESISKDERKKYKGHWVTYKNGLRMISSVGLLIKPRDRSYAFNGYTQSGLKLNFTICLQRLESVGCKLLHDEKEFNFTVREI